MQSDRKLTESNDDELSVCTQYLSQSESSNRLSSDDLKYDTSNE